MKIVLSVAGHLKTVPANYFVYETLREMGHEVRLFNFGVNGLYPRLIKAVSKKHFYAYTNGQMKKLVDTFRPDLFLTIFGFDHDRETIEYIREKGILTACWWLNDPFQIKRALATASSYDYYFTNAKGSVDDYKANGIKNAYFLPVAAFPRLHKKLPVTDKPYDICFAGDYGTPRENMLLEIAKDFRVSIFGPSWGKKLAPNSPLRKSLVKDGFFEPEYLVKIFNRSKIALNIHSWIGKWDYGLNPRVFEANGCGTFQLSDFKAEIPELYEPDKEIVLYNNMDELKEKAAFYLGSDAKRTTIAEQGYARTLKEHTYTHRMQKMFDIMGLSG